MTGAPFPERVAALQSQLAAGDAAGVRVAATTLLGDATLDPAQRAAVLRTRARAAEALRDPVSGIADLEAAVTLTPHDVRLWDDLGIQRSQAGRYAQAEEAFQQSIDRAPGNARAWNNLGNTRSAQGKSSLAIAAFREAVARKADYALAWANLGKALCDAGDLADGDAALTRALELEPANVTGLMALGTLRRRQGRVDDTIRAYARAAKAAPANAEACLQIAFGLTVRDDVAEAASVYAEAERRDPTLLRALIGGRLTLPYIPDSQAAVVAAREHYAAGIDDLTRIVPERIAGIAPAKVLDGMRWSNFLLAYQGEDDRALQQRYAAFIGATIDRVKPGARTPLQKRHRDGGRLRVGFLSAFYRDGTAGRYFERWITDLDRERFEVAVYHLVPGVDPLAARLRARADRFRHCPRWLPSQVEGVVRADELDALVFTELGMDATTFVLAALRMAPLQCAGWGHPVTTGHPTIDVFFTSGAMEPPGADAHYSERLVRLPGIGTRYAMPVVPPGATRAGCGLPEEGSLLLCPQSLFKIQPDDDVLLARVLAAAPAAKLVLFQGLHPKITAKYLARLDRALAAAGVAREGRVVVLPAVKHDEYLKINSVCDAMLDTTRWSGGNTSLDAIACGLPMVTLPGRFMRARQSAGMLALMEIDELVAQDLDDYVRIAARLADDRAWRDAISARIVAARGRIFDDPAPTTALADELLRLS
jgi:CRISPR-associated protein Csy1